MAASGATPVRRAEYVSWTVGYVLLVALAAVGAVPASFAVNNSLSTSQSVPYPALLVAASSLILGAAPTMAISAFARARLMAAALWSAVVVPTVLLLMYGGVLWFAVSIGASGADDKRLSVLLMPLVLLAPLGAVAGNAVIAALPVRRGRVMVVLMAAWTMFLVAVAVAGIAVTVDVWY